MYPIHLTFFCRLLTVRAEAFQKPTISKLLPLHNNYLFLTGQPEVVTNEETQEESAFLDAIMTTSVMKKAEKFLLDKGFITNTATSTRRNTRANVQSSNSRAVRDAIHQIWFGLYSRENRTLGSSGFEHVFLGEIKNGQVSGFHNCTAEVYLVVTKLCNLTYFFIAGVFFSKEETNNKLNYKGRIGTLVNLGTVRMIDEMYK